MTILTDGVHLISDMSLEELHHFAIDVMGFRMEWFQDKQDHPHYDLTTLNARNRAIRNGAVLVTAKELLQALLDAPYNKRWEARHSRMEE